MNIRQEWMTDSQYFGLDYPNNVLLEQAKERFEIQKNSLEGKDALIDGVEERVVAQIHLNNVKSNQDELKLFTDTTSAIHTGSIVEMENLTYLVTDDVKNNGAYKSTAILPSVFSITVYKNGNPLQIPIVVEGRIRLYSMGQDSTKYINVLSDEIIVYVPNNTDTETIDVDDVYKIGRRNYKIMTIQDVIKNGLLVIKMEVTLEEPVIPVNIYTLEILNGAEQTVKYGETLQLNIRVESDGVLVTPTPSLLFETSDGTVCTVDEDGLVLATNDSGSATVTVKLASDNNVYATITIKASPSSVVNYNYTLTGNVQPDNQILYNQTRTFTAVKYDSLDNVVPTQFLFSVVGDTPIDKYQIIVINDTQCSIKCKGYIYTITLRAMDLDNNQYIDKQITLKSLM
jgi:hypothetical protein